MPKSKAKKVPNITTRTMRREIIRPIWDGTKLIKAKSDDGTVWDVIGFHGDQDMMVLAIEKENLEDESHE